MTAAERGFLLLCAELGDGRKPLTPAQLRTLRERACAQARSTDDPTRPLHAADLRALGYDAAFSDRVVELLNRERDLDRYLSVAAELGIHPLTRVSGDYPPRLRRLGEGAPSVCFFRGEASLLHRPAVALVGSRELTPAGEAFARRVGTLAAAENYVLVSGNARGADQIAQAACLDAGGSVLAVLPDGLQEHTPQNERIAYLCEWGWHLPMVGYRALARNRLIHALGEKTLVAQSHLSGGTWSGSEENLRRGWSPLFVHDDGSPGCTALIALGAGAVKLEALCSLRGLEPLWIRLKIES